MPASNAGQLSDVAQVALRWLGNIYIGPLAVFFCTLILMLVFGGPLVGWLRRKRWRKDSETWTVREDTPDTHQAKQGTPSMGGIGIVGSAIFAFLALVTAVFSLFQVGFGQRQSLAAAMTTSWPHLTASLALVPLTVGLFALLGFADDWSKASGRGGLRARAKFLGQVALAVGFVGAWLVLIVTQSFQGVRFVFIDVAGALRAGGTPQLLLLLIVLSLVVVATSNAVNLTDGIDGLAAGLAVQVGFAFLLCGSYIAPGEIGLISTIFWMALGGACLGFLNFNRYPAKVFMGDTGSLAIGAALGVGAILNKAVFLLPFIGFIYFVEMLSVVAQVLWFKWTRRTSGEGKRLLRRAPLHHHFELAGWSEWRVVLTFWAVNAATTLLGLMLWNNELLPHWPN